MISVLLGNYRRTHFGRMRIQRAVLAFLLLIPLRLAADQVHPSLVFRSTHQSIWGEGAAAPPNSLVSTMITFLPIIVLFYLLMIRPVKRQEQERQRLLSGVKKNDRVVTTGGLIGTVTAVKEKEDEVTLKVDDSSNVRVRVTKSSIVRILGDETAKDTKDGGA